MLLFDLLGVVGVHAVRRVSETLVAAMELLEQRHPLGRQLLAPWIGRVDAGVNG